MGGFSYEILDASGESDDELIKYASKTEDYAHVFDIPNKLNEKLSNSYTQHLDDVELSVVQLLANGYNYGWDEDSTRNLISFNAGFDLKFANESYIETLPEDVEQQFKTVLVENGVNENCKYTINRHFSVDLNNDGNIDEVYSVTSLDRAMLLNGNQTDEELNEIDKNVKENGAFTAIIIKINDKISIADAYYVSTNYANRSEGAMILYTRNYDNLMVVDLNEDNVFELLYTVGGWEYYGKNLLVYNDGVYTKPMKISD